MKRYISWSGGKDSTASIILCYEHGIPVDGVVFCEVMFDHSRNISGENPKHIAWIYDVAIPIIEKVFGYNVIVIRDRSDYLTEFHRVYTRSRLKNGKKNGFFLGGHCRGNSRLKMRPVSKFFRSVGECERIVGIAADEPERLERLSNRGGRSVLAELGITEDMTYDICRRYNLLSPMYEFNSRGGCWFCPNSPIRELAHLAKEYPHLWDELEKLSLCDNLDSPNFKYGLTFAQVDEKVKALNNQITFFD